MQAIRKRSIKDYMVLSEVIASRVYYDVVSTHIMLLTGHYLPERFLRKSWIPTDWIVLNMPCDYSSRGELKCILFGLCEESSNRQAALCEWSM